jgi:hypothetical protein
MEYLITLRNCPARAISAIHKPHSFTTESTEKKPFYLLCALCVLCGLYDFPESTLTFFYYKSSRVRH